ncbi:MAG: nucleotidyltransferase domain-containing protein [bacterium]|nr:nucleotidyltransferase domain-containing protein [bacterium]MDZ4295972.1 nucleotidyltransferase domain-containing protein [Patescibacteria group bacterium]
MDDRQTLIILFGSQATGKRRPGSDTDVAVLSDHQLTLKEKTNLTVKLADALKVSDENIDLVDLWNASPLLQFEVARSGRLLSGDPFLFTRFRVLAFKRYADTAKFRRLREKLMQTYVQRTHP